jgi:hypothetical protein
VPAHATFAGFRFTTGQFGSSPTVIGSAFPHNISSLWSALLRSGKIYVCPILTHRTRSQETLPAFTVSSIAMGKLSPADVKGVRSLASFK